jgi:hypothetical protein
MLNQQELDSLLDVPHKISVEFSGQAPIPKSAAYSPMTNLTRTGFTFTGRELLHSIGSKTAALPINKSDEAIQSAYYFIHLLDFSSDPLHYKVEVESDLQTPRSQELGIGIMCLLAYKYFEISWDRLEPIPGPGLRFDYRGDAGNLKCIFEARGTKYLSNQSAQIDKGMEKKAAHHTRDERYDVELIISTCVGTSNVLPRIILADPKFEFSDLIFSENSNYFFRIRHYCRQLQACGLTKLAWYLHKSAQSFFKNGSVDLSIKMGKSEIVDYADFITIGNFNYFGKWFDYWVPLKSKRYSRLKKYEINSNIKIKNLKLFQGIREDVLDKIITKNIAEIEFTSDLLNVVEGSEDYPFKAMIGQDGAISAFKIDLEANRFN